MTKPANKTPPAILREDYLPPDYRIETARLHFDLGEARTIVKSQLALVCNHDRSEGLRPLVLQGQGLKLLALKVEGRSLGKKDYENTDETLTIWPEADHFTLDIETACDPGGNTELSGLYRATGLFLTQCEAEGFRKITYYSDRPDVLARFSTTIVADREKYPVLLSNGNLVAAGELPDGRHFATWHDPFPKPAYLFAMVAGRLTRIEDKFTTMSGREVSLHIYVQHHNREKCRHAMDSLKQAMRWDEETYGREYDLDLFMIVATDDFNMGAMENKGLNIFNSKYVLAKPDTATDNDFQNITGIVAHEYFHNWSGDRVTCRDWFQLSLKEGLTVFRDQQFMEDMTSPGVQRISEVNILRTHQFIEDGGPMAHPVRPDSYMEINNFYTMTVYNKGAELIRMCRTILGPEGFRKGTDLYFLRHDGQAVTTDDFVQALEDATGANLTQFRRWYCQAGTPEIQVTRSYDALAQTYALTIKQTCLPTPGQPVKEPLHIPIALGLLDKSGADMPLQLVGEERPVAGTRLLQLREAAETFLFIKVPQEPVPSILRGFSAPLKVALNLTDVERRFLMAHDSDAFNRWDAGQQLALKLILSLVRDYQEGRPMALESKFIEAFRQILSKPTADKAFQALILTMPSETYLADALEVIDPEAVHEARKFVRQTLAGTLQETFLTVYRQNQDSGPYRLDQEATGRRSLKNVCLAYLMELADGEGRDICLRQFDQAKNMTDVMAALTSIANHAGREREEALATFYEKWQDDSLVVDKWLALQAASSLPDTLERVKALTGHPAFTLRSPNKVRSLIGAFATNQVRFHNISGAGYAFLADYILALDSLNPQIAARLASSFTTWRRYDARRQSLMQSEFERVLQAPKLSRDVYEIVAKSLNYV